MAAGHSRQSSSLHVLVLEVSPEQVDPPLLGVGLVHVRDCWTIPDPHVTLHSELSNHSESPPFTGRRPVRTEKKGEIGNASKFLAYKHAAEGNNFLDSVHSKISEYVVLG